MRESNYDLSARIGAVISVLFCGGTIYGLSVLLMDKMADKLSTLLDAVIAAL